MMRSKGWHCSSSSLFNCGHYIESDKIGTKTIVPKHHSSICLIFPSETGISIQSTIYSVLDKNFTKIYIHIHQFKIHI